MLRASRPSSKRFKQILEQYGLQSEIVGFDESTRTALDAANTIGCELSQIVKSLVFKAKKSGGAILVLASGANRVDEKLLREIVGEKLGKADAEFVRQSTGFAIGGVPPFGHDKDLAIYIDEDLMQHETIWAAAGTPHSVFQLKPDELLKATEGRVIRIY